MSPRLDATLATLTLGLHLWTTSVPAQRPVQPLRVDRSIPFSTLGITAAYSATTLSNGAVLVMTGGDAIAVLLSTDGVRLARFTEKDIGDGGGAPRGGVVGNEVWLKKSLGSRATLFDANGKRTRTVDVPGYFQMPNGDPAPLGPPGGLGGPVLVGILPNDDLVVTALIPSSATIPTSWGRPPGASTVFIRTDPQGTVRNTVGWSPTSSRCAFNGSYLPLCQQPVWALATGGEFMATLDAPTLGSPPTAIDAVVVSARGDTLYRVAVPFEPRPLSRIEIDSVTTRVLASRRVSDLPNGADSIRKIFTPTIHPPLSTAFLGADGTLWVGLTVPQGEPARFAIIDPHGTLTDLIALPADVTLLGVGPRSAWGLKQVNRYHELVKLTW